MLGRGFAFGSFLLALGCMQPKAAATSPLDDSQLDRLHKENLRLEERLSEVQSERDAQKAALIRCQGSSEELGAPKEAAAGEPARRQLPVVRLVPDAAQEPNDGVPKGEERVILRASGDIEGEIAPAPKDVENTTISPDSGVRLSDPERPSSSSPPAKGSAERPAR